MSYNRLLVPLDGSRFAEHALPLALSIAHRSGAALRLVQVHAPMPSFSGAEAATWTFETEQTLIAAEQTRLEDLATRIATRTNLPCTATLLTDVSTVDGLCSTALQDEVDLIVMTTHGWGPLSRFWLGSVADELVRVAPRPVLAVRPSEGELDWMAAEPVFKHILVPLDGSPVSEHVLEATVAMGALMQSEYHLLHVRPEAGQLEAAQSYLDGVAERLRDLASPVHTQAVVGSHIATRILEVAEELHADLIAMETHGRSGLQRWRLGSVADKILRGASVPLLTHRTPAIVKDPARALAGHSPTTC